MAADTATYIFFYSEFYFPPSSKLTCLSYITMASDIMKHFTELLCRKKALKICHLHFFAYSLNNTLTGLVILQD